MGFAGALGGEQSISVWGLALSVLGVIAFVATGIR